MGKVLTRTMAAAAGAAMLLPLAACGGSADAGKTTISFLSWDNEQIMKPFIDEFEKENPDIKVDFGYAPPTNEYIQTLQTRLVGNQAPDVFVITSENKNDLIDNGYAFGHDRQVLRQEALAGEQGFPVTRRQTVRTVHFLVGRRHRL